MQSCMHNSACARVFVYMRLVAAGQMKGNIEEESDFAASYSAVGWAASWELGQILAC